MNLEENEKIKAELMPRKINEPKTPYHAPLGEDPEADEGAPSMHGTQPCMHYCRGTVNSQLAGVPTEGADMAPLTLEDVVDVHRASNGSVRR